MATAIEGNATRALALGRNNVERSASTLAGAWQSLLVRGDVVEICAVLRDASEGSEQMRISQPFSGLLAFEELREISRAVYGDKDAAPPSQKTNGQRPP
ncbi:MAG: hypothetical protein WCF18_22110 [Chthoniobacteraceae bacterium]